MPLSKPMIDLLATIKDDNDRKVLTEQFEKNSQIQDRFAGNLRQEDYDRQMNSQKTALAQVEAARADADKRAKVLQDWADKNVPVHNQLLSAHQQLEAKARQLEEQVRIAAEAAGSGNGDDPVSKAELMNLVNQRIAEFSRTNGAPTQQQIQQIVAEQATKMAEGLKNDFLTQTFPQSLTTVIQTTNLQLRYAREFPGKEMDSMKFLQFLGDRHAAVPTNELYEEFVRPEREEQQKAAHEKEITERVEAAVKETRSQMNVPGSSTTGAPADMGPLQIRRATPPPPNGNGVPVDLELGTNQAAMEAAAFLRQAGKA